MIVHLVDGTYEIFRQFYAPRPGHRDSDGIEIGATRGVVQSIFTMLQDGAIANEDWSALAAAEQGTPMHARYPDNVLCRGRVVRGDVMSQVEVQAGPHRLVSLLSTEAVDDLGLVPGAPAVASVKATNVVIELP